MVFKVIPVTAEVSGETMAVGESVSRCKSTFKSMAGKNDSARDGLTFATVSSRGGNDWVSGDTVQAFKATFAPMIA